MSVFSLKRNSTRRALTVVLVLVCLTGAAPQVKSPPQAKKKGAPKAALKAAPKPQPFPLGDFDIPTAEDMYEQREEEQAACLRSLGQSVPPRKLPADNAGTCPDCHVPLSKRKDNPEYFRWIKLNLGVLGLTPQECKLPGLYWTRDARVDTQSCMRGALDGIATLGKKTETAFFQSIERLRGLNPVLVRETEVARRSLNSPLISCFDETDAEVAKTWSALCQSRLKSGLSETQRERALQACTQFFTENLRLVVRHPVFPDRLILRMGQGGLTPLASAPVIARLQFREVFERSGLGGDSPLADGCLGAVGPLPGSAYVLSNAGCIRCVLASQPAATESQAQRTCSGQPSEQYAEAVTSYQSFEECFERLQAGDSRGLARACGRLEKSVMYSMDCEKRTAAQCLRDPSLRDRLGRRLKVPYQGAIQVLEKNPNWQLRSQ